MGAKSICDKCQWRWSYGGKLHCIKRDNPDCKYSPGRKECDHFEEGRNDKYWRGKDGNNRKGRCW